MNRKPLRSKPSRGSGIPRKVREAVLSRDGHHCRRCGRSVIDYPASIHHRWPRGRGGGYRLSNLVLLCGSGTTPGSCHAWAESQRAQAYSDGWLLYTGEDSAAVSILPDGGDWITLTDDGRVLTGSPRRRVVSQEVTG